MSIVNIIKRISVLGSLLVSMYVISPMALAANIGCPSTPDTPGVASLASIAVSSTLPIGSNIPGTEKTFSFTGNCNTTAGRNVPVGTALIACYYGSGSEISGMPGVYTTGVNGIGITLINQLGQRITGAGAGCDTRNTRLTTLASDRTFSTSMTLALVKTSENMTSGTLVRAQTVFGLGWYSTGYGIGSTTNSSVGYSGNVNYKGVTCSVGNGSIDVHLGKVPVSQFGGSGTTAGEKVFNLPVSCNDSVNVAMQMNAPSYISASNGIIAINSSGNSASGVGVQVLYNNNPVVFGQFFNVGSIPSAGATLNIPLTARYYQSESTVVPGIANASATVTMSYQ